MTDPAAIAKKLTEAQKRALRDMPNCGMYDWLDLCLAETAMGVALIDAAPGVPLTPLGRAVLAEIDKELRHD